MVLEWYTASFSWLFHGINFLWPVGSHSCAAAGDDSWDALSPTHNKLLTSTLLFTVNQLLLTVEDIVISLLHVSICCQTNRAPLSESYAWHIRLLEEISLVSNRQKCKYSTNTQPSTWIHITTFLKARIRLSHMAHFSELGLYFFLNFSPLTRFTETFSSLSTILNQSWYLKAKTVV